MAALWLNKHQNWAHSRVQHCVGDMEVEDFEAQFEDKAALRTDEM